MTGGRPIRFLALVIGGWAALRAMALWPEVDPIAAVGEVIGVEPAMASVASAPATPVTPIAAPLTTASAAHAMFIRTTAPPPRGSIAAPAPIVALATGGIVSQGASAPQVPPPLAPAPLASAPSRLAGSAWLIVRGGNAASLIGSQLGASQAGARLTYALGDTRRSALSARVSAPLGGRGAEAGVGIDWQPTRAPLHLIVEQRIALDGGRGGPAALVVGGIGPVEPIRGLRIEAYGQAGAIRRASTEGFADGAARASHPIVRGDGINLDIGAGSWAGIQRGAERVDIGPTLGVSAPIAARRVRLTIDWRERVAGRSRPGSGLAVSLGTDF